MRWHVATTDYTLISNPVYRHDTRMEVKKILPCLEEPSVDSGLLVPRYSVAFRDAIHVIIFFQRKRYFPDAASFFRQRISPRIN